MLDVRPLFPRERAALRELLEGLAPSDWALPTACPGWDVHDVVAHVLDDHVRRLSGTRDGYAGALFAPDETLPSFLARVNDEFVRALRQASPRVMTDLLAVLGEQLDRLWAGVDLTSPASFDVSWAHVGDAPTPAWLDVAREYTEFWVHQQQVRDAVGRPGADGPEFLEPVVATFARALPVALHDLDRPVGTVATLAVPGPAGGRWSAIRGETRWELAEAAHAGAATVTLDAADLWRLGSRGISPEQARERAELAGDPDLTAAMTSLLTVVA